MTSSTDFSTFVVVVAAGRGRVARNTLQEATALKIGMLLRGGEGG